MATDPTPFILEEGQIAYAYRLLPGIAHLRSEQDVAEFYVILSPMRQGAKHRLLVFSKKRLPDVNHPGEERAVALIARVADSYSAICEALGSDAADAGKGMYTFLGKGMSDTFLMSELMEPPQPGAEQQALAIRKVNSFKVQIKNPLQGFSRAVGPHAPPDVVTEAPDKLQYFGDEQWYHIPDISLLDYERVELQLWPIKRKIGDDLKQGVIQHLEALAKQEDLYHMGAAPGDDEGEEAGKSAAVAGTKGIFSRWLAK